PHQRLPRDPVWRGEAARGDRQSRDRPARASACRRAHTQCRSGHRQQAAAPLRRAQPAWHLGHHRDPRLWPDGATRCPAAPALLRPFADALSAMTFLSDIRDYPWTSLLTGLLPARIVNLLPARFQTRAAQIVPSASIAGNALTVVIAIMSFLACLTAGAVYMVNQSAEAWVKDISSEITVELDPVNAADIEKKMTLVSLFLAKQAGVTRVKPLTAEDSAKLLEPWLGHSEALSALPIPR